MRTFVVKYYCILECYQQLDLQVTLLSREEQADTDFLPFQTQHQFRTLYRRPNICSEPFSARR